MITLICLVWIRLCLHIVEVSIETVIFWRRSLLGGGNPCMEKFVVSQEECFIFFPFQFNFSHSVISLIHLVLLHAVNFYQTFGVHCCFCFPSISNTKVFTIRIPTQHIYKIDNLPSDKHQNHCSQNEVNICTWCFSRDTDKTPSGGQASDFGWERSCNGSKSSIKYFLQVIKIKHSPSNGLTYISSTAILRLSMKTWNHNQ